jgi:PAS domain S-box-containing protein
MPRKRSGPSEAPGGGDEQLYRELVEVSQGLICKHDLRGTLLYTNLSSARELGYPPGELTGRNLRELLAPSVAHLFDGYLQRIAAVGTHHGLMRLRKRDGEERLWFFRNQLVTVPGHEGYVVGHAVDVTERVEAEHTLRESEERARAVIEALEEGIVFEGTDGRLSGWNAAAERILQRSAEELHGLNTRDLRWGPIRDDGSPFPPAEFPGAVTLRTGQPCSRVIMGLERPSGEVVWLEINSQPLLRPEIEKPYGVVVSFTDVTARRRREQEREADLADTLAKLRILRGLLPICASCKRIRDDQGDWHQIESYVRDHSEAEFTHGVCPDCMEQLMADRPSPGGPDRRGA